MLRKIILITTLENLNFGNYCVNHINEFGQMKIQISKYKYFNFYEFNCCKMCHLKMTEYLPEKHTHSTTLFKLY